MYNFSLYIYFTITGATGGLSGGGAEALQEGQHLGQDLELRQQDVQLKRRS